VSSGELGRGGGGVQEVDRVKNPFVVKAKMGGLQASRVSRPPWGRGRWGPPWEGGGGYSES